MAYDDSSRLVWSLSGSGSGTAVTAAGNSGGWTAAVPNARSAVDLRRVDDVWLSVSAASGAGTGLAVTLDAYDNQGNLFPAILAVTLAGATPSRAVAFGGRHSGGAGTTYFVLPEWGRVSWAAPSGGALAGVEIALYGR